MPTRPPAAPPQLPGFEFVSVLGSGGFADVYLYNQLRPTRQVAVKVMLPHAVGRDEVDDFTAEANVMAQLSAHPFIVTIYEVGASPDGRGYLVMEYCPRPNLQQRYRRERISVAEAIRIGVQVAGAVETSHRAGILHRDIKPANILVTQFNRPALTDFGIAAETSAVPSEDSAGLSIPWSPPESFATPVRNTPQSDVWSLAATVYSLLAGRSPFELPGASNTSLDLMARIEGNTLPRLGRPDVPPSLHTVLATAMAKRTVDRYPSVLAFARALQKVQIELGMSVTPIDVIDDGIDDDLPQDDEGGATRIRSITSVSPQTPSPWQAGTSPSVPTAPHQTPVPVAASVDVDATVRARPGVMPGAVPGAFAGARLGAGAGPVASAPRQARLAEPPVADTQRRAPAQLAVDEPSTGARAARRKAPWIIGILVAVVLIGGGIVAATALHPAKAPATRAAAPQQAVSQASVPTPAKLTGTVAGDGKTVTFTWQDPSPQPGDAFLYGASAPGSTPQSLTSTTSTTATVPVVGSQTCLQVSLRRADGRTSDTPATVCVP